MSRIAFHPAYLYKRKKQMAWKGAPADVLAANPQSKFLARNWGWVMARGIVAVLGGVVALLWPGIALLWLALLFAAYMLADGIFGLLAAVHAARRHERWGFLTAEGLLGIVLGAVALFVPVAAIFAFVLIVSAWAILSGLALLFASVRLHRTHGRGLMVLGGLLSLMWGALLFLSPTFGALVLALWLGAYMVAFGVLMTALALRLRSRRQDGLMTVEM
jgi:uncharacterized membrane protein HdeD (DUF308 family)